jgi:hypothetical protein
MTKEIFILINLVLAFYNVGTIWAMEIDIFRNWKVLDPKNFHAVQNAHWKKLPYWVFIPLAIALCCSIGLFWYHPDKIPDWEIPFPFGFQIISHILTAIFGGQWQNELSKDEAGGESRYLKKIVKTHWIRTILWNSCGLILFYMTIQII